MCMPWSTPAIMHVTTATSSFLLRTDKSMGKLCSSRCWLYMMLTIMSQRFQLSSTTSTSHFLRQHPSTLTELQRHILVPGMYSSCSGAPFSPLLTLFRICAALTSAIVANVLVVHWQNLGAHWIYNIEKWVSLFTFPHSSHAFYFRWEEEQGGFREVWWL